MSSPVLGVIPARLGSTRLPRKPLHPLAGRTLIEWVWRRARSTELFDRLVVATDSEEVASVATDFGAEVRITAAHHPSGTDRIAEVARGGGFTAYETILNVQGDEPFVEAAHLEAVRALVQDEGWDTGTLATPFRSRTDWRSPDQVKVVRGDDGAALFFSRAPIPHFRDAGPDEPGNEGLLLRHLGIYAYRRDALLRWVSLPEGALERAERLEQLRPLAAGIRMGVAVVSGARPGVDTAADAARAERLLQADAS